MLPVAKQKKRRRLSPVNLLKSIRKTFSVLAFSRTKVEVNGYLQASQVAYRGGGLTGDIIWAQNSQIKSTKISRCKSAHNWNRYVLGI